MNSLTSFSENFSVEDNNYRFFQQDGATAHSACKSLALWNAFWDRNLVFLCGLLRHLINPHVTTTCRLVSKTYIKESTSPCSLSLSHTHKHTHTHRKLAPETHGKI
jgi:hypothetical protein